MVTCQNLSELIPVHSDYWYLGVTLTAAQNSRYQLATAFFLLHLVRGSESEPPRNPSGERWGPARIHSTS